MPVRQIHAYCGTHIWSSPFSDKTGRGGVRTIHSIVSCTLHQDPAICHSHVFCQDGQLHHWRVLIAAHIVSRSVNAMLCSNYVLEKGRQSVLSQLFCPTCANNNPRLSCGPHIFSKKNRTKKFQILPLFVLEPRGNKKWKWIMWANWEGAIHFH